MLLQKDRLDWMARFVIAAFRDEPDKIPHLGRLVRNLKQEILDYVNLIRIYNRAISILRENPGEKGHDMVEILRSGNRESTWQNQKQ